MDGIIATANTIRLERYPDAAVAYAAGSIVRGEGTASSDLDLVVVYRSLPNAYRESFRFAETPVEAFVHDPETLNHFFLDVDRPNGMPVLAQMVLEGVALPEEDEFSRAMKSLAEAVIREGPPALTEAVERWMRYMITDLIEDLRAPRSDDELLATGVKLYQDLADYHFRRNGLWSAKAKAIPRALQRADPSLWSRYIGSFERLFRTRDAGPVIDLAHEILQPAGGPLFEGYRADAPESWRKPWSKDAG